MQPFLQSRVDFQDILMPCLLNDGFPCLSSAVDARICFFPVVVYGAFHMFGLNLHFPPEKEMILLRNTTVFSIKEVLWAIIRASYGLYFKKEKTIRFKSVYRVLADEIERVVGVEGLPIHHQVFGKGVVTYGQIILVAPLVVTYLLSQLYTLIEDLASLRALLSCCLQTVQEANFVPHNYFSACTGKLFLGLQPFHHTVGDNKASITAAHRPRLLFIGQHIRGRILKLRVAQAVISLPLAMPLTLLAET